MNRAYYQYKIITYNVFDKERGNFSYTEFKMYDLEEYCYIYLTDNGRIYYDD